MIAEHGRFFSQNACAMLESLSTFKSTYHYYHVCENYSKKATIISKVTTDYFLYCKQQHLSIRNTSILNV